MIEKVRDGTDFGVSKSLSFASARGSSIASFNSSWRRSQMALSVKTCNEVKVRVVEVVSGRAKTFSRPSATRNSLSKG